MLKLITGLLKNKLPLKSRFVFLSALSVSFVFRILYPEIYHHFDVTTFVEWGAYVNPFKSVYLTSCFCNYPILGMLFSTGILKLFDFEIFSFLLFLCLIDAINVVLIWFLMRLMQIPYALMWSGLIGLSLSSWIGGAQWGQIDNIGQLFLLLICICFYFFLKLESKNKKDINLLILILALMLSCILLIKQLLIFALFPILIYLVSYLFLQNNKIKLIVYLLSLFFVFLFSIFVVDWWLNVPETYYFSHLEKVFLEGSDHINTISGNGFNIWLLFYSNQNQLATEPLLFGLSSKFLGLFLFAFLNIFTFIFSIHFIKKFKSNFALIFAFFLGVFAFYNLGFNLVLTGTHERYLYHFYPYYLIFLLYFYFKFKTQLNFLKTDLIIAFIGSSLYGFFVFCILMKYLDDLLFHRILLFFHLLILFRMVFLFNKLKKIIILT